MLVIKVEIFLVTTTAGRRNLGAEQLHKIIRLPSCRSSTPYDVATLVLVLVLCDCYHNCSASYYQHLQPAALNSWISVATSCYDSVL